MAVPTITAYTSAAGETSDNKVHTFTTPVCNTGDFLVAFLGVASLNLGPITWTALHSMSGGGYTFYRIASDEDSVGKQYTFGTSVANRSGVVCTAFAGVETLVAIEASSSAVDTGTTGTSVASITTMDANCLLWWASNTTHSTPAIPASMTQLAPQLDVGTWHIRTATEAQAAAGASGTRTTTNDGSNNYYTSFLALLPEATNTIRTGRDVQIDQIHGNMGGLNELAAGENFNIARTLIEFDLDSVPDNAVITTCQLRLFQGRKFSYATTTFPVYRMIQAWVEGTGVGTAGDISGATWAKYDGTNAWPNGNGGFGKGDCEQTSIGSITISSGAANGWKVWDLSVTAKSDLGTEGLMLKATAESGDQHCFWSLDYTLVPAYVPQLRLFYSVPPRSFATIVG